MKYLIIIAAALLSGCGGETLTQSVCGPTEGVVTNVVDGDTVDVTAGGEIFRLRYLNLDAPELNSSSSESAECLAQEAKEVNEELVLGREVTIEYDQECEDRYDRLLGFVFRGPRMVNFILVERGYGKVLLIAPNLSLASEFESLEALAIEQSAGIWGACE
jgi:micrococcal nuclease